MEWASGCGVAHRVRRGSRVRRGFRVRRGSDNSASACCMAGPSSNLGSAPQRRPSTERKQWGDPEWHRGLLYMYKILYVCNKRLAACHQTFKKNITSHTSVPSVTRWIILLKILKIKSLLNVLRADGFKIFLHLNCSEKYFYFLSSCLLQWKHWLILEILSEAASKLPFQFNQFRKIVSWLNNLILFP